MELYINAIDAQDVKFKLFDDKKCVAEYAAKLGFQEGHKILGHLKRFLTKHAKLGRPKAILLYSGQGSYTGLRISSSIAQALSLAWDIPYKTTKKTL